MDQVFGPIYDDLYLLYIAERTYLQRGQTNAGILAIHRAIEQAQIQLVRDRGITLRADAKYLLLISFSEMVYRPLTKFAQEERSQRDNDPDQDINPSMAQDIQTIASAASQNIYSGGEVTAHAILNVLPTVWERIRTGASKIWEGG